MALPFPTIRVRRKRNDGELALRFVVCVQTGRPDFKFALSFSLASPPPLLPPFRGDPLFSNFRQGRRDRMLYPQLMPDSGPWYPYIERLEPHSDLAGPITALVFGREHFNVVEGIFGQIDSALLDRVDREWQVIRDEFVQLAANSSHAMRVPRTQQRVCDLLVHSLKRSVASFARAGQYFSGIQRALADLQAFVRYRQGVEHGSYEAVGYELDTIGGFSPHIEHVKRAYLDGCSCWWLTNKLENWFGYENYTPEFGEWWPLYNFATYEQPFPPHLLNEPDFPDTPLSRATTASGSIIPRDMTAPDALLAVTRNELNTRPRGRSPAREMPLGRATSGRSSSSHRYRSRSRSRSRSPRGSRHRGRPVSRSPEPVQASYENWTSDELPPRELTRAERRLYAKQAPPNWVPCLQFGSNVDPSHQHNLGSGWHARLNSAQRFALFNLNSSLERQWSLATDSHDPVPQAVFNQAATTVVPPPHFFMGSEARMRMVVANWFAGEDILLSRIIANPDAEGATPGRWRQFLSGKAHRKTAPATGGSLAASDVPVERRVDFNPSLAKKGAALAADEQDNSDHNDSIFGRDTEFKNGFALVHSNTVLNLRGVPVDFGAAFGTPLNAPAVRLWGAIAAWSCRETLFRTTLYKFVRYLHECQASSDSLDQRLRDVLAIWDGDIGNNGLVPDDAITSPLIDFDWPTRFAALVRLARVMSVWPGSAPIVRWLAWLEWNNAGNRLSEDDGAVFEEEVWLFYVQSHYDYRRYVPVLPTLLPLDPSSLPWAR